MNNLYMVLYQCSRCQYITDKKASYEKHLKTKKHLKNVPEKHVICQVSDDVNRAVSTTPESGDNSTINSNDRDSIHGKNTIIQETKEELLCKMKKMKEYILFLEGRIDDLEEQQENQYNFNVKIINTMKTLYKKTSKETGNDDDSIDSETREIII